MPAPDDLTAELDRIRAEFRTFGSNDGMAFRLLAAVEAVLELAASAHCSDEEYDAVNDRYSTPVRWTLDPGRVREAITRALTGGTGGG